MLSETTHALIASLTRLCRDLARGRYGDAEKLFELTRTNRDYPESIVELAESFGLMLVQIEAREFHLHQVIDELRRVKAELEQAKERLARENIGLKKSLGLNYTPRRIVGQSRRMNQILSQVDRVADAPVSVLINGETGTGKELIAKALHYNSVRKEGPFIALNCSAIPESLFESELFGIEKGVASGVEKRIGRIEQANGGTLFLDEIGDLPLACQSKILRVLETRELSRVGGRENISVDIRVVAATHRKLLDEVAAKRFRQDLLYRLKVVTLEMPPLRDRAEDIRLLANFFLENYAARMGRSSLSIDSEVFECLEAYSWPGNVRELENEMERAAALCPGGCIGVDDLSVEVRNNICQQAAGSPDVEFSLKEIEKRAILQALVRTDGNKTEAAKQLGLSREGLRKKMARFEL